MQGSRPLGGESEASGESESAESGLSAAEAGTAGLR